MKNRAGATGADQNIDVIAGTAYAAHCWCYDNKDPLTDGPLPQWGQMPEGAQEAWLHTAQLLVAAMEQYEQFSAKDLGRQAYENFHRSLSLPWVEWEKADPKERLAFEAVVRHVANVLNMDEDEYQELSNHEMSWRKWIETKLENGNGQDV